MFIPAYEKTGSSLKLSIEKKWEFYYKDYVFLFYFLTMHVLPGLEADCSSGFDHFQLGRPV